jgi:hypothetical protein
MVFYDFLKAFETWILYNLSPWILICFAHYLHYIIFTVSNFWHLILKPIFSLHYRSNLSQMLLQIQNQLFYHLHNLMPSFPVWQIYWGIFLIDNNVVQIWCQQNGSTSKLARQKFKNTQKIPLIGEKSAQILCQPMLMCNYFCSLPAAPACRIWEPRGHLWYLVFYD